MLADAGYPFGITTDGRYVYWVEHPRGDSGDDSDGRLAARVLRAPKAPGGKTEVLAVGQPWARAIARDGDFVYWDTYDDKTGRIDIYRVRADCAPGCVPVSVARASPGYRVGTILRAAPGVLFVQTDNGASYRLAPETSALAPAGIDTSYLPSLVATDDAVYATASYVPFVARDLLEGGATREFQRVPAPADGGDYRRRYVRCGTATAARKYEWERFGSTQMRWMSRGLVLAPSGPRPCEVENPRS